MSYPILSLEELDTNTILYLILFFVKFKHKQFLNLDVLRASEKVADKKNSYHALTITVVLGQTVKTLALLRHTKT